MAYKSYASNANNYAIYGPCTFKKEFGYWNNGDDGCGAQDGHEYYCENSKNTKAPVPCPKVTKLYQASQIKTTIYSNFVNQQFAWFCFSLRAPVTSSNVGTTVSIRVKTQGQISYDDKNFYIAQSNKYNDSVPTCIRHYVPSGGKNTDVLLTSQPNSKNANYNIYIKYALIRWDN